MSRSSSPLPSKRVELSDMSGLAAGLIHPLLAGAAIGAQAAPVPCLSFVIQIIDQIITGCENVRVNRAAIESLKQQSQRLSEILGQVNQKRENELMRKTISDMIDVLTSIMMKTQIWSSYGRVKSFLLQAEIMTDIGQCTTQINDRIKYFELQEQIAIKAGVDHVQDHQEADAQRQQQEFNRLHDDMKKMQDELKKLRNDSPKHKLAAQALYNVQNKFKMLLPEVELDAGEVIRIGTTPIGGTAEFDFWEGLYLDNEKCLLKTIRTANFSEKQKARLKREVEIWRKIWDIDQGRYFVPFYGVCYFDGPYPCLVSPLYKNGDIMKYIQSNPSVDRLFIIRHIAEGLKLLHTQTPPIAHGELKAAKIMVSDDGTPLIADFGLSKIIEETTGAPFTRTSIASDQYRWFAPEVCSDSFVVTTASDVFSFAMVILEIMTGAVPFASIKRAPEIIPRVLKGERPSRPTDLDVVKHGLDDKLWELMERCWVQKPEDRPTIAHILEELPSSAS